MPGCAAIGCNNRSEKGYTMKCFPRDPALRTLWTEKVSRADWVPSNNSFLCHVHFDSDQWILSQTGRIKLKRNAVPSIFTITSTRKSPRKRRKIANVKIHKSIWFNEYLDDSLDFPTLIKPRIALPNQVGIKIGTKSISKTKMRSQNKPQELIVVSDDGAKVVAQNGTISDKDIEKSISETKVKAEIESQGQSDQELDDIERKLRWICDGVLQSDEKSKIEPVSNKNGKIMTSGTSFDEKSSRLNGEAIDKEDDMRGAVERKRRSRYGIMKDIEKIAAPENSVNGIPSREEKDEKPCITAPTESRFTIKVTGMDEDVSEIVRSLGSEPIMQYKSTNESTRNRRGFVTSVISVVDRSVKKNGNDLIKPKVETEELPCNETAAADLNWQMNENLNKLLVESPNEDENSTNFIQLQKKIKFQAGVIRTLTQQLVGNEDLETPMGRLNSVPGGNNAVVESTLCDYQSEQNNLLKELSERVVQLDEINKSLNKQLAEKDRQTKKLDWQIRQRDNRIKELNWKLEKASKYLERSEKNTNTYRKKMINMQSLLARRKIREDKYQTNDLSIAQMEESESVADVVEKRCKIEVQSDIDENAVYGTVQDIFDESNDCDDDPSVIDTREDFLREFEGAL